DHSSGCVGFSQHEAMLPLNLRGEHYMFLLTVSRGQLCALRISHKKRCQVFPSVPNGGETADVALCSANTIAVCLLRNFHVPALIPRVDFIKRSILGTR